MKISEFCRLKRYAGIVFKDRSRKTTNNIRLVKAEDGSVIATIHHLFATLNLKVESNSQNLIDFDVTETVTESSYDLQTKKIHLEVESFDEEGNSVPAIAFKPTFDFIDPDGSRWIQIHVDYFEDYAPSIEYCDLFLYVEFLNSDGSYSTQVKRKLLKNGKIKQNDTAIGPIKMTNLRNEFILNDHTIVLEHDPFCHMKLLPNIKGSLSHHRKAMRFGAQQSMAMESGDCLPTERDPCQSAGCVKVVPWRLKYLEDHGNTLRSNLTVMLAWCGDQQEQIYELEKEADFNNCENIPQDPLNFPSGKAVDGFIVTGPVIRYFASNKCKEGFKLKIEII